MLFSVPSVFSVVQTCDLDLLFKKLFSVPSVFSVVRYLALW